LATPQAPRQVNRKAPLQATRPPAEPSPCWRQDRSLSWARGRDPRIPSGRVGGAGRAASVAARRDGNESKPRDGGRAAISRFFPGYGRFSRILAPGNSRFRAPAMRGCFYTKQLIQRCYSQRRQAIFAPERVFLREFSRFNRELGEPVQRRPLP